MSYRFLRDLMFRLDAETAHHFGLNSLNALEMTGLLKQVIPPLPARPVRVMGLDFANPVGLAAGLDKNADHLEALARLGFGFVEVGTVTPRPQPGNTRPRMFRLPAAEGIINRMGFNNKGVDHLVEQVASTDIDSRIGINIGKNFDTPVENAVDDYLLCLERVYRHADYVTINISSPNTPGLRDLQFGEALSNLLSRLKSAQFDLADRYDRYVPMAVKVAPDLSGSEVSELAAIFTEQSVDAVIATNTTISRDGVTGMSGADEKGGLSGRPVFAKSTEIVRQFKQHLPAAMPIIAVGGIMSAADANAKLAAGADLVQIYSGLIYQGPALIKAIIESLE